MNTLNLRQFLFLVIFMLIAGEHVYAAGSLSSISNHLNKFIQVVLYISYVLAIIFGARVGVKYYYGDENGSQYLKSWGFGVAFIIILRAILAFIELEKVSKGLGF